jgi:hypothetical protein
VFLDLHTTSLAWSQALGLGLGEPQPAPGAATASTSTTISTSDGGITKPLLTWLEDTLLTMNTDDKLLGGIWRALGFTTDVSGHTAGDDDGKEKAAGFVWDRSSMETVLLAGLGCLWTPHTSASRLGRQPYLVPWLRQAERFLQRVPPHHLLFCSACDCSKGLTTITYHC